VVVAGVGAGGTRDVAEQLSYISTGGVLGVALIGASATLLIIDFMMVQQRPGTPVHVADAADGRRRLGAAITGVVGAAAMTAGAVGASGTREVTDQLSYLATGGLVGLAFLGVAATVLILDAMEGPTASVARQDHRLAAVSAADDRPLAAVPRSGFVSEDLVAIPGSRRVHRADCLLVAGKRAAAPVPGHDAANRLEACRVCEPALDARSSA
jgi:hypothetical protein